MDRVFLESGEMFDPPQPTVKRLKTEVCTFTKNIALATGSVGVLTYDLFDKTSNDENLAIMFSVPWDNILYKNWFAVGIFPRSRACDESLYKEMYYNSQNGFVREEAKGSSITYMGDHLIVKATMSPVGRAIMKVEVWDKVVVPATK